MKTFHKAESIVTNKKISIRKARWTARLLLVLVSLLVGTAVFEVSVRLLKIDYNLNPNWKYHPVIGWSEVPNGKYDFVNKGKKVHVEFNSKGFRDVEHSLKKPAGTKRIVVIGDSFCEAVQVNLEETFFRRLQKKLNESGKEKWEVINLGVGDFGTTQEWVALTQLGETYSPDVVICEIFPLNDICNNTLELCDLCKSKNDRYRPYFVEARKELKLTSAQPFRNLLRRYFVSYGVIEHRILKSMKQRLDAEFQNYYTQRTKEMGLAPLGPALHTYVSDEQQHEVVAKGWRITEMILDKMASWCGQRNIQFIPMVVPFEACVGPKNWKGFSSSTPPPKMIQDYPERRLGRLFDRLGVPRVLLKEPFEQNIDSVLPYTGGHFSPEGHRVAAEALYAKMVEIGLVGKETCPPKRE